jgi:hypothetical protein
MKSGRICAVEYLAGESDAELIREAQEVFTTKGLPMGAEGFEVWDHARFVYRFVVEGTKQYQPVRDGLKGPPSLLERIFRGWPWKFSGGELLHPTTILWSPASSD